MCRMSSLHLCQPLPRCGPNHQNYTSTCALKLGLIVRDGSLAQWQLVLMSGMLSLCLNQSPPSAGLTHCYNAPAWCTMKVSPIVRGGQLAHWGGSCGALLMCYVYMPSFPQSWTHPLLAYIHMAHWRLVLLWGSASFSRTKTGWDCLPDISWPWRVNMKVNIGPFVVRGRPVFLFDQKTWKHCQKYI